ncbi:mesoderm-specific transcript homolog protein [Aplysia californica]|uniref:Mesoderm-specific transcript homolog protein n=1 Tax=Aplysia californica TaxID=6500 RepID=A0ABM0K9U4_APLCA|nr:mesoderm-specific transcript homolog protein [Aplysia californica]XP_005112373.1 mesoderm-specific transcript homolog protein [Aplysia californica]XP_005112374.1 mesoderm-specific transcript homolog protein [Aplysia californica]
MIGHFVSCAVAVGLVAVFISYPQPPLSSRLEQWKQLGEFLSVGKRKIFFVDEKGQGSSGPVVCLHGFPTSSYDWIKILPDMKSQFSRVIMLDFLGYGFSDKPEDHTYTIAEQAEIVETLLEKLSVPSAHVLSHDYGDTVALELLARSNSKKLSFVMQSLTMLNGGVFPETHRPRISQKLLLTPGLGYVVSRLFSLPIFSRGFGEVFGASKPTNEDYADFWAALRYNDGDRAAYRIINFLRERQEFKGRWVGALQSTDLSVLMLYGPADPVNPPSFAAHFRKVVPRHKLVTLADSVGHYPQWEDPETVGREFLKFIQSLETQTRS